MPKKKIIKHKSKPNLLLRPLIILGAITLGIILWYSWPRPVPVGINLVGSETGTITLALTPSTLSLAPNAESTLTLTIDAGTGHAIGATIDLAYDAAKVGTPVITQGNFFTSSLGAVTVENGIINFTYNVPTDDAVGVTGSGTVATIKINPPVEGSSALTFTDKTRAYAAEFTSNTLKSVSDATIVVAAAAASVEPSAIASAEPSATASVAPSTPASSNPSKPDKPTGLRSNCTDGGNKITLRWDAITGANSYKLRMDQKDGNSDKSIDGITKTDYEFNVIPDQKYSWWVHTTKDGLDSEEAKINEVVCAKTIASATDTPTPKPTVKPTPKPTVKPTARPTSTPITRTPTPRPSTTASTSYNLPSPKPYTCPELCGDGICNVTCGESFQNCKADCNSQNYSTGTNVTEVAPTPTPSFWQQLLAWFSDLFSPAK